MIQEQIIQTIDEIQGMLAKLVVKEVFAEGGAGSGHWGHKGREKRLGGSQAGHAKGGFSANGDTVTKVGQIGEMVVSKMGLKSLARKEGYKRPVDFKQEQFGVEVKAFTSKAKNIRVRMVKAARKRKVAYCKKMKLRPKTVMVVLDINKGSANVYERKGFGNFRVKNMTFVGKYNL